MRKVIINLGIIFLSFLLLQGYTQTKQDEKLFHEAKILIFDKEWESAQIKLEKLLEEYPDSSWFSQALFYLAKCLEEQKGKEREALRVYQDYLKRKGRSKSLMEESERSIISLAFELYEKGKRSYLREIEKRLSSSNRAIKYYAAIKLSYVEEKKVAAKGIPVLKEIIKKERDDELRDRAKIALLRVDPGALKDLEEERTERRALLLKIRVWKDGELTLKINIPWALADLALGSISEKEKSMLREEGYDLDTITKTLVEAGEIIHIENKKEGTVIKIWID